MKTITDLSNSIIKDILAWKKAQDMISLTLENMLKEAKDKKHIVEQKVDGQSAILNYNKKEETKFGSLHGVIMSDFPLTKDIDSLFKKNNITQAKIVGEMAGYDKGKIIPFNESESLIKNAKADKNKIHWFPYQIIELDGKKFGNTFEEYKSSWPLLVKLFSGSKFVHPVEYTEGDIKEAYNRIVLKNKNEGIVIRLSNNKIYKVKPTFTYDLVILAVGSKKGKNWPKGKIGMTLMAFMDNNKVFRTAGNIGTGWTDKESAELYNWAQKNKVGEDETYIWVKPERIVKVQWERTTYKKMKSYSYNKGKYKFEGELDSATIVKPRFKGYRTDKRVNPNDLRLTQAPDWNLKRRMANNVVLNFLVNGCGQKYIKADFPKHPDSIIIKNNEYSPNISELDIYNYYQGIKNDLLKEIRGHNIFIKMMLKTGPIFIRHPFKGNSPYIKINNDKDFEEYCTGRTIEYHLTLDRHNTPYYIIDYDSNQDWITIKKNTYDIADHLVKKSDVKKVEIRYSGQRSFHILGYLKKAKPINEARTELIEWLKETFKDHKDLKVTESAKGKLIGALGIDPLKKNGGQIALWSLRPNGLCCIKIDKNKIMKFEKKEASLEATFKKLTGKNFIFNRNKKMATKVIDIFLGKN